jgi:hypothetical protein
MKLNGCGVKINGNPPIIAIGDFTGVSNRVALKIHAMP